MIFIDNIIIEKRKTYKMWLEGLDRASVVLVSPIENETVLYHKTKNFGYTHYLNCWGSNINQVSADYLNDCIKYNEPIAVSSPRGNKIEYRKIIEIYELD